MAIFFTGPTLGTAGFLAAGDATAGRLEDKGFLVAAGEALDVVVGCLAAVLAAEAAVGLLKGARLEAVLVGLLVVEEAVERAVVVVLGGGLAAATAAVVPFF